MDVYSIKGDRLNSVELKSFKKEREIQELVEKNTETLFDVEFVSSEFTIGEFRIDTLCFDDETNSFVIIEYKKGSSYSVIDQGYSYLSKMLNNKDSFILEYCRKKKVSVDVEVDWSQSKIIFVSPSFNSYQKNSVNFKDMNKFELWEIKRFDNDTIVLNQYQSKSEESIEKVVGNSDSMINKVNKEIKVYKEEDHTSKISSELLEKWEDFKDLINELGGVELVPKTHYISLKFESKSVCYCIFRNESISVEIQRGNTKTDGTKSKNFFDLDDPKKISKSSDWKWKDGTKGNLYKIRFNNKLDVNYLMFLVKQKYDSLNS
tara:strand:- start:912 stop:1868 length:957 start_codon:yes stop_codon:yes gene_type:complete